MTKVSRPHRPTTPPTQGAWERCVRRDPPPWLRAPPSFRATGARWDDDGARWHDPSWPLDRICENRLAPQRVCPVFWGSGPHATLVNGAKGGLATVEATGAIGRALRPGLDVLLWDHGVNDFSRVRNQLDDARRAFAWFLARAHAEFPSLAAVVVVFWQDELLALKAACDGKAAAHEGWSEQVPNALRPALVDAARRWPGTAVVTMSLPAFCRKTSERPACHPAAFTDWKTSHPTSLQNAAFADLVIWQLLPAFDATHAARCSVPLASDPPADDSVPPRASHRFHAPKLAASFFGWSPLASPPPPREDLAVLCAPGLSRAGRERRKSGKVDCVNGFNFTVFTTDMALPETPRWARLDFSELLWGPALDGNGCAGWGISGCRDPKRSDSEYRYSSTSTPKCPNGGGTSVQRCRRAPRGVERYPVWPGLPIRAADVGLRVSSKYAGCFMCSTLHPAGQTRYYAPGVVGNATAAPQHQMELCLVIPRVEAAHVIFWCPAEECYPVIRGGRGHSSLGHAALKPSIMVFCGHHQEANLL